MTGARDRRGAQRRPKLVLGTLNGIGQSVRSVQVVFDFGERRFSYVVEAVSVLAAVWLAEQVMVLEEGFAADSCCRVVSCLV